MQNESIKLFVSRDRKCTIPTQKLASTVSPDLMAQNKWTHFDFLRVPKDYSGIFFQNFLTLFAGSSQGRPWLL